VDAHLEVAGGRHPLACDRVVIGRSSRSDIVLDADGQVSRTHAVLDRIAGRWILRDVGSRNGTRVNGEPVRGPVRLRAGDEIRIGRSTLLLRAVPPADDPVTERQSPPPTLTARERDVLLAVVRPLVAAGPFRQPASTAEIARSLWVTDNAVKRHLQHLYRKFGVDGRGTARQARLAAAALQCGAVTVAEAQRAA
jgi:pSer/pThr/pTyr-binding forkhead associated (FHA) protein